MFQLPVLPKLGLAKGWKSCKFTSRNYLSRNLKEHFKNKNPITCVHISVLVQCSVDSQGEFSAAAYPVLIQSTEQTVFCEYWVPSETN